MTVDELLERIRQGATSAGESAFRTATCVGKKAGEMFNTSKHQITIFDLKNEINEVYKEIGALIYNTYKTGEETEEIVSEKLALIDEKMAKIEEIRATIDDIRDAKTCANCGTRSEKSAQYCKKCGNKI